MQRIATEPVSHKPCDRCRFDEAAHVVTAALGHLTNGSCMVWGLDADTQ
jgi:hypothetical protein